MKPPLARRLVNRIYGFSFNRHIWANKVQLLNGYLTDPDFAVFKYLDQPDGLILDIGANRGHCSLAILSTTQKLKVLAFEPNPEMSQPLDFVKRRFPGRFDFHEIALGARSSEANLYIPAVGNKVVSTRASCRLEELQKEYVQEQLVEEVGGDQSEIREIIKRVEMRPLDDFGFDPVAIKIDVEGFESKVIEGAKETLRRCRPMLLIEMNNQAEYLPLLQASGYEFYRFHHESGQLQSISTDEHYLNVICLHKDGLSKSLQGLASLL